MSIKRDENNKIINCHSNIVQMSISQLMWFEKKRLLPALIESLEDLKEGIVQVVGNIFSIITIILFPISLLIIAYSERKRSKEHMKSWGESWK